MESSSDGWEDVPAEENGWENVSLSEPEVQATRSPASDDGWEDVPVTKTEAADGWEAAPATPAAPKSATPIQDALANFPKWNPVAPQQDINFGSVPLENQRQPTPEEIAKQIHDEQAVDGVSADFANAADSLASGVLAPLKIPAQVAAGILARTSAAANAAIRKVLGEPVTFENIFDAAMNPDAIQAMRDKEDQNPSFKKNLSQAPTITDKIRIIGQEIIPPMLAEDVLSPYDIGLVRGLSPKGYENAGEAIFKLGLNVGADPLSYATAFGKVAPLVKGETATPEAVEELLSNWKARTGRGGGFGAETQRGERALFQFKLPGDSRPALTIKGQSVMEGLDEMGAAIESKLPIRPLMQYSGMTKFDNAWHLSSIEGASIMPKADKAKALLLSVGEPTETVIRHAANVSEHGVEAGSVLSKAQGLKLTAEESEQARQLQLNWQRVNEMGNQELLGAGGRDLSAIQPRVPSPPEQAKILKDLQKTYGEIPRVIVEDGDKAYDLTFSGGSGMYDYGRSLTDEAKAAKKLQGGLDELNRTVKSGGFAVTPNSAKARTELSTEVMNSLMERQYGVKGAFNANKNEVVMNNYMNKLDASRKLRFYNFTRDSYGVPKEGIQDFISKAGERVEYARSQGLAPEVEDLRQALMKPEDFRPISQKMWGTLGPYYSPAGEKMMVERDLFYPKQIADRVETLFSQPSRNKFLQEVSWWQRQKSLNMLTGPMRFGKQSTENAFKASTLGIWPEMAKEVEMGLSRSKDHITRLADSIPTVSETAFSLADFKDDVKVSIKMLTDPEVNNGVNAFYANLHNGAKTGNLDKIAFGDTLKNLGAAAINPKTYVRLLNENPLSQGIRHVGNYSDGLVKRAYFRKLLNDGHQVDEAVRMVGDHLMDFSSTTPVVKGMRYVNPFASFQLKNIETLIPMIAQKPGMTNLINPFDGYLKKAIEDYSGWNPEDYKALQQAIPFYRHPVLGPLLRGQTSLLGSKDKAMDMLNQYASWGLGPEASKRLDSGLQLSLQIPTNLQAAMDITDTGRANNVFSSPLIAAAAIGLTSTDPYTGKQLESVGTPMEGTDKVVAMLKAVNPVDYPKLYNGMVMPILRRAIPEFQKRLEEGPITRRLAEVLKIELGSDAPLKQVKLSEATIRSLTQMKFMGMGTLDKADFTYYMHQMQLLRAFDKSDKLIDRKATLEGRAETLRTIGAMKTVADQINMNAKIYGDYKARADSLGAVMDEDTKSVMGLDLKPAEDMEELDGLQPTPSTGPNREPQSMEAPKYIPSDFKRLGPDSPITKTVMPQIEAIQPFYEKAAQEIRDKQEPGFKDIEQRLLQKYPGQEKQIQEFLQKKHQEIEKGIDQEMQMYLDRSKDQFIKPKDRETERLPASEK